ncbi:MAG: DUF4199 domain-containing protein [Bacteroidia bacterium]|nr:DUF4199 domain-containing protein [Bacteroidia bacterium]
MKKIILTYGLLSGLLCSIWIIFSVYIATDDLMDIGMIVGFASMILAFSFIFVAIIKYRNNYNQGVISFGNAFKIGVTIALIASTIYVLVWMIYFQFYCPDFFEKYTESYINKMKASGASQELMDTTFKKMQEDGIYYKNNAWYRIFMTYLEILPVGIIISLIAALILKRKVAKSQ